MYKIAFFLIRFYYENILPNLPIIDTYLPCLPILFS